MGMKYNPLSGEFDIVNTKVGDIKGIAKGSVLFVGDLKITEDNDNFFWDNANDRLGIGTNSPDTKLHIAGKGRIDAGGNTPSQNIDASLVVTGGAGILEFALNSENANPDMTFLHNARTRMQLKYDTALNGLTIFVDDTNTGSSGLGYTALKFFIDGTTDKIGIGTTSPKAKLHIEGDTAVRRALIVQGAASQSGNLTEWQDSSGAVLANITANGGININPTSGIKFLIDDSSSDAWFEGNTTEVSGDVRFTILGGRDNAYLRIGAGDAAEYAILSLGYATNSFDRSYTEEFRVSRNNVGDFEIIKKIGTDVDIMSYVVLDDKLHFYDNSLTIDNAGNVGIGIDTPLAKLHIGTGATTTIGQIIKGVASQSANLLEVQDSTGASDFTVDNNGAINLPSTTFASQRGVIKKNSINFLHDFNYGNNGTVITVGRNVFIGEDSGNLTMGSTATITSHGSYNTGIGYQTLNSVTTGYFNTGIGTRALTGITTGRENTAFGTDSALKISTGYRNVAVGAYSMINTTTGYENFALGFNSLKLNISGYRNTAIGVGAAQSTTGNYNTGLGYNVMLYNSSGIGNVGIGTQALLFNTTKGYNVAIGYRAGAYYGSGTDALTLSENSVFIGYHSRGGGDDQTNQVVIGYNALGIGSNTVVLGNDDITTTILKGDVGIGTTTPDETLQIVGTFKSGEDVDNYSEFESDGTYVAKGDATTWDDIVGSLVATKLESVVGKLNYNFAENTITMQSGGSITNTSDRLMFNYQYPHAAIENGCMRLHIHWEQVNTNKIEFTVQYRIQSNGAAKNTTWTSVTVNSTDDSVFTYVSGTLNQITEIVHVDMTGAGISSTVQFRLARVDSTGGDIEATFVDAHIERDTIGSREEYVK